MGEVKVRRSGGQTFAAVPPGATNVVRIPARTTGRADTLPLHVIVSASVEVRVEVTRPERDGWAPIRVLHLAYEPIAFNLPDDDSFSVAVRNMGSAPADIHVNLLWEA